MILVMGKWRVAFTVFVVGLSILCSSCRGEDFITQEFSFPANTKPHESGWKYRGTVRMTSSGPWLERNSKTIEIYVYDNAGKQTLLERLTIPVGPLQVAVVWNEERVLSIALVEEGNPFGAGDYNALLLQRGPSPVKKLTYDPVARFVAK